MVLKKIFIVCSIFLAGLSTVSCGFLSNLFGGKTTTSLYPIRQNNKNGYINRKGEIVIQPQFEITLPFSEGLAAVCIDNRKCGYIDETGKFIINPQFQMVYRFSEGLAAVITENKLGYIDKTGKYVINPQFDVSGGPLGNDPYFTFSDGLARVMIGEKYGFIDKTGKIAINPQFDGAMPFFESLAAVRIGEKWGFVDKEGKIVINPQFEAAQPLVGGLAVVKVGKQFGYIDKTGKIIINPQFDNAYPFSDEGIAAVELGQKVGFIDREGKYVVSPQFGRETFGMLGNTAILFLVTSDLGRISFSEGLTAIQVGDKADSIGFADKTGKIVINPQFSRATPFYGGLALVVFKTSGGDEMAWIDQEGKTVWRETREAPRQAANTTSNVSNTSNVNAAQTNVAPNGNVPSNTASNTAPQTSETTVYEGTLNNNYQISMSLTRSGESLSGYVTPKSGGASIPVRGTINSSGEFNLSEYDDQDNWTGTYRGKISGGTIDGSWTKPDGSASRPLYLQKK